MDSILWRDLLTAYSKASLKLQTPGEEDEHNLNEQDPPGHHMLEAKIPETSIEEIWSKSCQKYKVHSLQYNVDSDTVDFAMLYSL